METFAPASREEWETQFKKERKPTAAAILKERTHCKNGHEFTPENTRIHPKQGFRQCRACRTISSRENEARRQEKARIAKELAEKEALSKAERDILDSYNRMRERKNADWRASFEAKRLGRPLTEDEILLEKMAKQADKLNYLKLTPAQSEASDRLNNQADSTSGAKCKDNPKPYIDYDERTPPSVVEASKLCAGCPILLECAAYAKVLKPKLGVWAGVVWVDGKPQS